MNIAVFCGSHLGRNPHFAEAARETGRLLARRGHRLLYGGSAWGYMGLVAQGALEEGGHVTAVIPSLFDQEVIDSQPVTELIVVPSMSHRKDLLARRSDAFLALPGGAGTLDEVTEMMTNNQLHLEGGLSESRGQFGQREYSGDFGNFGDFGDSGDFGRLKPIGLLNIDGFYDPFLAQLRLMADEGLLTENHLVALTHAHTPETLLNLIDSI